MDDILLIIHQLIDIWVVSAFWPLWTVLQWTSMYKFLGICVVFAHVPQSGIAESYGYSVPKRTVLSHPVGRQAAWKGNGVKKVKPGKACPGLDLKTPTRWQLGRPMEPSPATRPSSAVVFPLVCSLFRSVCDVTVRSWMVSVEVKGSWTKLKWSTASVFWEGPQIAIPQLFP